MLYVVCIQKYPAAGVAMVDCLMLIAPGRHTVHCPHIPLAWVRPCLEHYPVTCILSSAGSDLPFSGFSQESRNDPIHKRGKCSQTNSEKMGNLENLDRPPP